uniref:Uncharacterized protein n=1 Tax=Ditylenchus dipsaci TaxID=166011 RepID=A0A915ENM1_9BILA
MLPRSDVPFQVSEFIFPATIPPVISRAASHRSLDSYSGNCHTSTFSSSQPIKGSTSISNSQEPNALSSTFISLEHHALTSSPKHSCSSNHPVAKGQVTLFQCGFQFKRKTTLLDYGFQFKKSIKTNIQIISPVLTPDAKGDLDFQDSNRTAAGSDQCAMSTRRLVSHMISSSASSHVFSPTPVKRDDEVEVSQIGPKGHLQLNQSPASVSCQSSGLQFLQSCYGGSSDDEEDLQSTEFNSLLTSVSHPVSIKSLSVCTESAASITPRPKCSGIDSPPHVVDNTFSLTPFTDCS